MTEHPGDEIEMYFSDDALLSKNKTDSVDKNVSINNIWLNIRFSMRSRVAAWPRAVLKKLNINVYFHSIPKVTASMSYFNRYSPDYLHIFRLLMHFLA